VTQRERARKWERTKREWIMSEPPGERREQMRELLKDIPALVLLGRRRLREAQELIEKVFGPSRRKKSGRTEGVVSSRDEPISNRDDAIFTEDRGQRGRDMSPESDREGAIRRLRTAALQAFGGDAERAETWLWSDNSGLGGMTPFRATMSGRLADALGAAGIVEKVAGRDGGRCDKCDEFLERAAEMVEGQVSCECEGFCECYGNDGAMRAAAEDIANRDTLLGLAERIRAMKGGGR